MARHRHEGLEIRPDRTRLRQFLVTPSVFLIATTALTIALSGFDPRAVGSVVLILLLVLLPFFFLVIPTILFEKIIIEDFTARFTFIMLVFRFTRVIEIANITTIEQRYRSTRKGSPSVISIRAGDDDIMVSVAKYKQSDIEKMLRRLKDRNPSIQITDTT